MFPVLDDLNICCFNRLLLSASILSALAFCGRCVCPPHKLNFFIYGKQNPQPNKAKRDQAVRIQRFVEIEQACEKLQCGIDVHQYAGKIIRDFPHTHIKE